MKQNKIPILNVFYKIFDSYKKWIKLLLGFVLIQACIKILGLLINLSLIRILPKSEYAYFTIAFAMITVLTGVGDSGIGIGMSGIGGKIWNNIEKMGSLVSSASRLARKMSIAVAVVLMPFLIFLLHDKGESFQISILTSFFTFLSGYFILQYNIHAFVLKINNSFLKLQKIELINGLLRLSIVIVGGFIIILNSFKTIFIFSITYLINFILINKQSKNFIYKSPARKEYNRELSGIIRNQFPNSLYHNLSGQIGVLLLAIFDESANGIADLGALTRLTMAFSIINMVSGTIIGPKYSKIQNIEILKRRFIELISLFALGIIIVITIVAAVPGLFLEVLGPEYSELEFELILISLSSLFEIFGRLVYYLISSKGWIIKWWLNIPFRLFIQISSIIIFDVSTLQGVIYISIISNISIIPVYFLVFFHELKSFKAESIKSNSN